MKFEIVDFYPVEGKKKFIGTMHIYVIDYELDIRGITVLKNGKYYLFLMPGKKVPDSEDPTKLVFYPMIDFTNRDKKKEVIDFLQKEGVKYVKEFYKEQAKQKKKDELYKKLVQ